MDKKYVTSCCIDCGIRLSKNNYSRCKSCSNKFNGRKKSRREKISKSRIGDLNPTKKLSVREKISKTLKKKYLSGEIFSIFVNGHNINKGRKRKKEYIEKFKGKNNPFFGKKHSEEFKKKYKEKRKLWKTPVTDSSIEVKIQKFLQKLGIEFFTHQYMKIEHGYQCDIFIPRQIVFQKYGEIIEIKQNTVIECDGDYWHGNPRKYNKEELTEKQILQKERDSLRTQELLEKGFNVIRLWENEIKVMEINDFKERI